MDESFPNVLRTYRKSMGWTQEELSQKWSYSFETISAWERGKRTPGNQEIPRLAKFLAVLPEELAAIITRSRSQLLKRSTQNTSQWEVNVETWGELQHIYRNRTDFNRDFSYARMFEHARHILATGISLNVISHNYSKDDLAKSIIETNCQMQLCFLDPTGKKCVEREEEENYPANTLADLTRSSMLLLQILRNRIGRTAPERSQNLEIRVYDLTPRFNIYMVDDTLMTVQNYGYGRGGDTPTLLLKRKTTGGLFDFYASAAHYILEHSTHTTKR
jgi:transcriptional regulator with XRE-family HTH domain